MQHGVGVLFAGDTFRWRANKQDDPPHWIPDKWLAEVDKPDPVMQLPFTWFISDWFYQGDKTTPNTGKVYVQQGMYSERE